MLTTNINFGGKIVALTILALFWLGSAAVIMLLLFVFTDIIFTMIMFVGIMLHISGEYVPICVVKFYVAFLLATLVNIFVIVFTYVIIPYLVHKLEKYNWLVYMCNFHTQSNSDYTMEMFSDYVPTEIFNELLFPCSLELDLFEEKLASQDYDAVALLMSYKHNREYKFELTVEHMNDHANYQCIDILLDSRYYLSDIFNAVFKNAGNINLNFVDALLERGGNRVKLEKFNSIRVQNVQHMILLDYILTKVKAINNSNVLDANLVRMLNDECYKINANSVEILLKHGANPSIDNGSLLIRSAKQQNIEILDLLLAYGGDARVNDDYLFRYSIVEKNHVIAKHLAKKYSFYHISQDGDMLTGNILGAPAIGSANNC